MLALGQKEAGIASLEKASNEAPRDAEIRAALIRNKTQHVDAVLADAEHQREAGQYDAAEAAYRKVLAIEARHTRAQQGVRAVLLSSVVFGLEHSQWLAGILAGIAYGWLYLRTGNLWVAIVAHAVTNAGLGIWVLATGAWYFW